VTKQIGQEVLPEIEDMEDITEIYKNPFGMNKNEFK
jgi:transglutaminase 1